MDRYFYTTPSSGWTPGYHKPGKFYVIDRFAPKDTYVCSCPDRTDAEKIAAFYNEQHKARS